MAKNTRGAETMTVSGPHSGALRSWSARLLATSVLLILSTLIPVHIHAAQKAVLWVRVFDVATEKPVPGAEVTFIGTAIRMVTDKDGEFGIELNGGKYTLSIIKEGYFNSFYPDVWVEPGEVTRLRCDVAAGNPNERFYFGLGGINIVGRKSLLPQKAETTHEITSAVIEHNLSTNLGDVLFLVPGVERTKPPGLSELTQVQLRGSGNVPGTSTNPGAGDRNSALFGTKIIVDDINLSNNANLQVGDGTGYGEVKTYAGSGLDVRAIPADNIEKVDVITGVPSVEYGDLVSGLVIVKTKSEGQPHRLKLKSNPDTKEANLSGAWKAHRTGISYNLNYAYSERSIRREGDEYYRYNAQLQFRNKFRNDGILMSNRFYYTGVQDETNLDPDDPLSIEQYNRDKTYIYGNSLDFKFGEKTTVEWRGNLKFTNRDSYRQSLTGADTRVLSTATEPGTNEGVLQAGAYYYQIWTKGEEWNIDARLNYRRRFDLFGLGNNLLLGGEYAYDDNVGAGKIFDPMKPPNGKLGARPLPFDAVPEIKTTSLYAEDDIKGFLFKRPYTLSLGLRYEIYTPTAINFDGIWNDKPFVSSRNGSFYNPRIRFLFELAEPTRIRLGWGRSSKMPSMTSIFHGPDYVDVVEENVTPPDSTPLITTYVYNFDNPNLKGYQSEKFEMSLDQKIGSAVFTGTGFYQRADDIPYSVYTPLVLHRYRWENWPDPSSRTVIDTLYLISTQGKRYVKNLGWYENYGMEFEMQTERIKLISTVFRITASLINSRTGADGTYMSEARTVSALGGRTIYPYFYYREGWTRKMIVNYSADWFARPLGLWITFFVQQTLFDANQNYEDPNQYAAAYYDPIEGRTIPLSPAGSDSLGLTRSFDDTYILVWKRPNDRFLFNVNVTKSLGPGAELSFFVHNFFDDAAFWLDPRDNAWKSRNHNIFYGIEVSLVLNDLWRRVRSD